MFSFRFRTSAFVLVCLFAASQSWALGVPYEVKDINPGYSDSNPLNITALGNRVIFGATHDVYGKEHWSSDGTAVGTVMLADINPGGSSISTWDAIVPFGGYAYFPGYDNVSYLSELWRTDGTPGGTTRVLAGVTLYQLVNLGGVMAFESGNGGSYAGGLYYTDGSVGGTVGPLGLNVYVTGDNLAGAGDIAYFPASNGVDGTEFFRSDGTSAGTEMVKDIYAGGSNNSSPQHLAMIGSLCYFLASDAAGIGYYVSDGTATGTVRLGGGPSGVIPARTSSVAVANGITFIFLNDGVHGLELWRTDGTVAGSSMIKDINPGSGSGISVPALAAMGTCVYFSANDGVNGEELWRSDGTEAGTYMVKDIAPGGQYSWPTEITNINGVLFFTATDGLSGVPWTSDGTEAGTMKLVSSGPGPLGGSGYTYANGLVFFAARNATDGIELWAVGGAPVGVPGDGHTGDPVLAVRWASPFHGVASVSYVLPEAATTSFDVYDVRGREVAQLAEGTQGPGEHHVTLDASSWPAGVYFYRLHSGTRTLSYHTVLIR